MHIIFSDVLHDFITIYLDGIMIISKIEEEHIEHVRFALEKLRQYNL